MWVGIASPFTVTVAISANATIADCTAVTSAQIKAKSPTGTVATWTAAITAQTSSVCTIAHTFATAGTDVTEAGSWVLVTECFTSAGTIPCGPNKVTATDYFGE